MGNYIIALFCSKCIFCHYGLISPKKGNLLTENNFHFYAAGIKWLYAIPYI